MPDPRKEVAEDTGHLSPGRLHTGWRTAAAFTVLLFLDHICEDTQEDFSTASESVKTVGQGAGSSWEHCMCRGRDGTQGPARAAEPALWLVLLPLGAGPALPSCSCFLAWPEGRPSSHACPMLSVAQTASREHRPPGAIRDPRAQVDVPGIAWPELVFVCPVPLAQPGGPDQGRRRSFPSSSEAGKEAKEWNPGRLKETAVS